MKITERRIAVQDSKIRGGIAARMGKFARKVDKGADTAARVMLVNEALHTFVDQLYLYEAGRFVYIDPVTCQILTPCPWGASGWKTSGLKQHEARTLSKILIGRDQSKQNALFNYRADTKTWHIDLQLYPGWSKAYTYLILKPVTIDEWHRVT